MITITKVGSLVKIDGIEGKDNVYESISNFQGARMSADGTQLSLQIGEVNIDYKPLANFTIGGVVPTNAATVQSALALVFPSAAPATALPTEYPATYSAMQASITADPTTKRDFFVSADETKNNAFTKYYYDGSSIQFISGGNQLGTSTEIFTDTFNRANTVGSLGTAPDGAPYDMSGAGLAGAGITSNKFTASGTVYASKLFTRPVVRAGGTFEFTSLSGTVALILSADATLSLQKMLHLIITPTNYTLTWWNGGVQTQPMASGTFSNDGLALAINTTYSVYMSVNGNNVHVELPDGNSYDAYDTNVSSLAGNRVIWELTSNTHKWSSFRVFTSSDTVQCGAFTSLKGITNTPIGAGVPSVGYFTGVGIGTKAPSLARLHIVNNNRGSTIEGLKIESDSNGAVIRLKTTSSGFQPSIYFDEGQASANVPAIYSGGNSFDIRVYVGGADRLVFPFAGGAYFNSGNICIGGTSAGAKFDVQSTAAGSLPFPRMTQAQRTAISSPAVGLHVYQTDAGANGEGVYVNKSTGWVKAY